MNNLPKTSGVYCIKNLRNGKLYVGGTINLYERFIMHKSGLNNQRHENKPLQKSFNKFPSETLEFQVLAECSVKKVKDLEQTYMDKFIKDLGWKHLFNEHPNSKSPAGYKYSVEAIEKMKKAGKGRIFTEEHRANMCISQQRRRLAEAVA